MQVMDGDDLRGEAFLLFGRLVGRSDPGRFEAWAGLGLTMTQLRVLFALRAEDGLSAGALAELLAVTPSTITRIMDRIVQNRLVRRDVGDDDRRLVRHRLTENGLATIEQMEREFRDRMDRVFAQLSDDQLERLVLGLRDLFSAMEIVDSTEPAKVAV